MMFKAASRTCVGRPIAKELEIRHWLVKPLSVDCINATYRIEDQARKFDTHFSSLRSFGTLQSSYISCPNPEAIEIL